MTNKTQQTLQRLWSIAREKRGDATAHHAMLPPGFATRFASRWAAGADQTAAPVLWERVTASVLVTALLICGATVLLRPLPPPVPEPDMLISLFKARPAPDDDFPF